MHRTWHIIKAEDERHLIGGLALKIRNRSRTCGPESWRATEKPDSDPGCIDPVVGGQRKNQSLKGD